MQSPDQYSQDNQEELQMNQPGFFSMQQEHIQVTDDLYIGENSGSNSKSF